MASLKLLQTVGASILAFTSKGKVLVERDSASGPGSHAQNSGVRTKRKALLPQPMQLATFTQYG
jgi:predicted RNase H-like nuclease (RuvC/YqgF family)